MKRLFPTAEMTLGPFFPREFAEGVNDLTAGAADAIEIAGRVTEVDGRPLDNVILEIWQPEHSGWGRAATDAGGQYRFRVRRPGAIAGRAPHVNFLILYSGLMRQLQTTLFFEAASDPVLEAVEPRRRGLLIARREAQNRYRFDIRLRGDDETPFFDD